LKVLILSIKRQQNLMTEDSQAVEKSFRTASKACLIPRWRVIS